MSFVCVEPIGKTTPELRKLFVQLALSAEPRGTVLYVLDGAYQSMIRQEGSLHSEGRYLLRVVAKNWEDGYLCASSLSAKDFNEGPVYHVSLPTFTVQCTDKETLQKTFPGVMVAVS